MQECSCRRFAKLPETGNAELVWQQLGGSVVEAHPTASPRRPNISFAYGRYDGKRPRAPRKRHCVSKLGLRGNSRQAALRLTHEGIETLVAPPFGSSHCGKAAGIAVPIAETEREGILRSSRQAGSGLRLALFAPFDRCTGVALRRCCAKGGVRDRLRCMAGRW